MFSVSGEPRCCLTFGKPQTKSEIDNDKLRHIEHELENLKHQYHKLENKQVDNEYKGTESKESRLRTEISDMKIIRKNLENDKLELEKQLETSRKLTENLESMNAKTEKELLELKRSYQEEQADKSDKEKQLKKLAEERKHFINRVQELSVIGNIFIFLLHIFILFLQMYAILFF